MYSATNIKTNLFINHTLKKIQSLTQEDEFISFISVIYTEILQNIVI